MTCLNLRRGLKRDAVRACPIEFFSAHLGLMWKTFPSLKLFEQNETKNQRKTNYYFIYKFIHEGLVCTSASPPQENRSNR
jgi:hypothetical protein